MPELDPGPQYKEKPTPKSWLAHTHTHARSHKHTLPPPHPQITSGTVAPGRARRTRLLRCLLMPARTTRQQLPASFQSRPAAAPTPGRHGPGTPRQRLLPWVPSLTRLPEGSVPSELNFPGRQSITQKRLFLLSYRKMASALKTRAVAAGSLSSRTAGATQRDPASEKSAVAKVSVRVGTGEKRWGLV